MRAFNNLNWCATTPSHATCSICLSSSTPPSLPGVAERAAHVSSRRWRGVEAPYSFISLSGYGPNINIERDPRFGRNSELPGEGASGRPCLCWC